MPEPIPSQTSDNGAPEPLLTEPQTSPPESLLRPGRRKLWDIPHKYHCPVIGTCLCVAELRRIVARLVPRGTAPPSDYEVHVRCRARGQADEREARIRDLEQTLVAREAEVARLAERERVLSVRIAFLDGGEAAR